MTMIGTYALVMMASGRLRSSPKNGYEVAVHLRREECCTDAVLVAVSGYGEEQARHRSEEAGINHHMVKPVNIAALFSLMERP